MRYCSERASRVQCAFDAGHAQHVRHARWKPATAVAQNQKEGLQAGERRAQPAQIAFHQCIHSDIRPSLAVDLDE